MTSPKQPTDPAMLRVVQARWRDTSAGTAPGMWSSLKCALALLDYEHRGGTWIPRSGQRW